MSLKPTFSNGWDRLTYIVAEAQLLVAGALVTLGILLWVFDPSIPSVPGWVFDLLTGALILGPPSFMAGLKVAKWLRIRQFVEVHHVNAVSDTVEKWRVPPEVWEDKEVEGPAPYPINDGSAWAVREFEWFADVSEEGRLVVRGCWMAGVRDTELMTSKAHMEDIHGTLIDGYVSIGRLRARISRMGAEVQEATISEVAESMERGTMLSKSAVSESWSNAKQDADDSGEDDLPRIEDADLPGGEVERPEPTAEEIADAVRANAKGAATDGGDP